MSEFKSKNLTNKGLDLLASALNGGSIEFTKIQLGSGKYDSDMADATSLVSVKQTLPINKITRKGNNVILNTSLIAKEIKESFEWTELGVWAKGADNKEILYLYSYTDKSSYISKDMQNEKLIQVSVMVSNVENVTVTIDNSLVYLTKADLDPLLDELRDRDDELQEEIDNLARQLGNISLDWNSINGKPNTFPPSTHKHNASDINGLPTHLPANGGNADTVDGKHASDFAEVNHSHNGYADEAITVTRRVSPLNFNDAIQNGVYHYWHDSGLINAPTGTSAIGTLLVFYGNNFPAQIFSDYLGNFWMRSRGAGLNEWTSWRQIYTTAYKPTPADIGAATSSHTHDYAPSTHTHDYAASNHGHSNATTSTAGYMSKEDKTKLNGIDTNANKTTIVDNLTSTSSTSGLSAAQGKILKGLIDELKSQIGGLMKPEYIYRQIYMGSTTLVSDSGYSGYINVRTTEVPGNFDIVIDGVVFQRSHSFIISDNGSERTFKIPFKSSFSIKANTPAVTHCVITRTS